MVLVATSLVSFNLYRSPHGGFFSGWGDPDRLTEQTVSRLEAAGVHDGYAEYWVSYKLDYFGAGRLAITTVGGPDRFPVLDRQVRASGTTAWLFVPLNNTSEGQFAGSNVIRGPGAMPELVFLATLNRLGVSYRVVDAGLVQAVIPDQPITPAQVGLAGL